MSIVSEKEKRSRKVFVCLTVKGVWPIMVAQERLTAEVV